MLPRGAANSRFRIPSSLRESEYLMRTLLWSLALLIPLCLAVGCGSSSSPPKASPGAGTGFKDTSGKGNMKTIVD